MTGILALFSRGGLTLLMLCLMAVLDSAYTPGNGFCIITLLLLLLQRTTRCCVVFHVLIRAHVKLLLAIIWVLLNFAVTLGLLLLGTGFHSDAGSYFLLWKVLVGMLFLVVADCKAGLVSPGCYAGTTHFSLLS
ncbi:uncharacterized protein J3R85_002336 [Psidium guajava]|nr:uncharacterized protein J3R85_002336 [Psidium guajava]